MTVSAILASKGRDVFTTGPDTLMRDAVDLLAAKKVGAIVVVDENERVCGIISERDIVRELSVAGPAAMDQTISTCMTKKVFSAQETDTIEAVMELMSTNRFRHLPVVTDGKLVGIVSIGDVVKRKIQQAERDAEDLRNYIATA